MQTPAPAPAPEATPTTEAAGGEAAQLPATTANNLLGSWQWTNFSDPANGPTTMVYCGDESSSDDFLKYLGFAAIYFFQDGNLLIDLMADGGTMGFTSAEDGS